MPTSKLKRWPICIGCRSQDALSLNSASWSTSLSMASHRLYVDDMIQPVSTLQRQVTFRSATTNDLFVPRARLRFGECAFSITAPLLWNSLPAETRKVATLETFKKKLKTFMFYKHPGDWLSFLHFYLYVAGRLFAVSYYCLLLLLLLYRGISIYYFRTRHISKADRPGQETCAYSACQVTPFSSHRFHHCGGGGRCGHGGGPRIPYVRGILVLIILARMYFAWRFSRRTTLCAERLVRGRLARWSRRMSHVRHPPAVYWFTSIPFHSIPEVAVISVHLLIRMLNFVWRPWRLEVYVQPICRISNAGHMKTKEKFPSLVEKNVYRVFRTNHRPICCYSREVIGVQMCQYVEIKCHCVSVHVQLR